MVDMDYLIDGLTELYSDESVLSPKSMSVWYDKLTSVTKVIEGELNSYNYQSQRRITTALQNIILRTQFSCMCVYSRYKSYPGLVDCLVGTDKRMRLIATTGDLKTFYELFYKENVDNNVLTTIQRIYKYVEFLIECAVGDILNTDDLSLISVITKRIARDHGVYPEIIKNNMDKIDDMISYDMMEYVDNDRIILMMDDLCVHDYDNLMSINNSKLEHINDVVKNSCKAEVVLSVDGSNSIPHTDNYNYIISQARVDKYGARAHLYSDIYEYLKNIQTYTKGLSDDEINEYTKTYANNLIQVGTRSVLNRYVEYILHETREYFTISINGSDTNGSEDALNWLKSLIRVWILLTNRIL